MLLWWLGGWWWLGGNGIKVIVWRLRRHTITIISSISGGVGMCGKVKILRDLRVKKFGVEKKVEMVDVYYIDHFGVKKNKVYEKEYFKEWFKENKKNLKRVVVKLEGMEGGWVWVVSSKSGKSYWRKFNEDVSIKILIKDLEE